MKFTTVVITATLAQISSANSDKESKLIRKRNANLKNEQTGAQFISEENVLPIGRQSDKHDFLESEAAEADMLAEDWDGPYYDYDYSDSYNYDYSNSYNYGYGPHYGYGSPGQYGPYGGYDDPNHYGPHGGYGNPSHYGPHYDYGNPSPYDYGNPSHYGPHYDYGNPSHYGPHYDYGSPSPYDPHYDYGSGSYFYDLGDSDTEYSEFGRIA